MTLFELCFFLLTSTKTQRLGNNAELKATALAASCPEAAAPNPTSYAQPLWDLYEAKNCPEAFLTTPSRRWARCLRRLRFLGGSLLGLSPYNMAGRAGPAEASRGRVELSYPGQGGGEGSESSPRVQAQENEALKTRIRKLAVS